jgi:hypothetical protein
MMVGGDSGLVGEPEHAAEAKRPTLLESRGLEGCINPL